ncbi:MAG TPA: hypothetical protein VLT36_20640 [Candidatus Dormibacteraeota bacterium]|nr:hypothetical protein [Candidatus Dormibacteraeota bacterium]
MSLVKFECPVCNQNMECERARSGDIIHCPGCGAQIRIPFHNPAELEGALSRAELVAPAAAPATSPEASTAAGHKEPEKREATVNCPACQAQLKVVIPADSHGPTTTLLSAPARREPTHPVSPHTGGEGEHLDFAHMSLEEREKQIAAAREAHPIRANPVVKPRLEYILSGKAPSSKANAEDHPKDSGDDHHTVAE